MADVVVLPFASINKDSWTADWDTLACNASEPNAFAEHWFVRASIDHLGEPPFARMAIVRDGDTLLGMIPLAPQIRYGRIPVRHMQNWLHYHSFLGTPLIAKGNETLFWAALLDGLDADRTAPGFLHIAGLVEDGPVHRALMNTRRADIVHRTSRALLEHGMSPDDYYSSHVRKKKRKEIGRLGHRLAELGAVETVHFQANDDVGLWCETFLDLEASGWKGRSGTALSHDENTRAFFCAALTGAAAAGRLDVLRLDVAARPVAMLVNFLTPPGAFSFKIAYDEAYARYSPGVLLEIENLQLLRRDDVAWMDSCAVEDHAMINSLWAGRRTIIRLSIPLKGARRRLAFSTARTLERASALFRGLK